MASVKAGNGFAVMGTGRPCGMSQDAWVLWLEREALAKAARAKRPRRQSKRPGARGDTFKEYQP